MKIELKHLAPYLPYELKCKWNQSNPFVLAGLQQGNESVNNDLWTWKHGSTYFTGYLYECKPILRPLSDLTKEIEHNGEKFVPSDRTQVGFQHGRIYCNIGVVENRITTNTITYSDMTYLLSLHFDVFGLIEKGLAIDINTLK